MVPPAGFEPALRANLALTVYKTAFLPLEDRGTLYNRTKIKIELHGKAGGAGLNRTINQFDIIMEKHHFFFDFLKKLNHRRTGFEILFKVFIFAPFDFSLSLRTIYQKPFYLVWLPRIELGTYCLKGSYSNLLSYNHNQQKEDNNFMEICRVCFFGWDRRARTFAYLCQRQMP